MTQLAALTVSIDGQQLDMSPEICAVAAAVSQLCVRGATWPGYQLNKLLYQPDITAGSHAWCEILDGGTTSWLEVRH